MDTLRKDFVYAWRMLWKDRGISFIALLTLALGIGANTSIFSVVNAVLLKPLPYRDPERLVLVKERIPKLIATPISMPAPDIPRFERENQTFEGVAGYKAELQDLSAPGEGRRIHSVRATANLFPLLGVSPLLGRTFTPQEDAPDQRVTVLSYGFWQSAFAGDRGVIGRTVTLDRKNYTIIGVMPKVFQFPPRGMDFGGAGDLWVPMGFTKEELAAKGDNFDYSAIARLKPGITAERAGADVSAIAQRIQAEFPAEIRKEFQLQALVQPLREEVVKNSRFLLLVLLVAVGLVLLIACTNIANLLLARASGRKREMAIRAALGANRWRLMRQSLAECLMLSLAGGALGLAAAAWGTDVLVAAIPQTIPSVELVGVDRGVLLFTLALSIFTGMLFGIAPAFSAARADVNDALKEGGRSAMSGRGRSRLSALLVAGEVALSMLLLIGAGLLIRSFLNLRAVDEGFQPDRVLAMTVEVPWAQYSKPADRQNFYRELLSRLQAIPGVQSASVSTSMPLRGRSMRIFAPRGTTEISAQKPPVTRDHAISEDYLQTVGIALRKGRTFTADDREGTERVAMVNETLARRHYPGQDPIGQYLKFAPPQGESPWVKIVGMVADVKLDGPDSEVTEQTYTPVRQNPGFTPSFVALRTTGDPASLAVPARMAVRSLDPQQAVTDVAPMRSLVERSTAPQQFNMAVFGVFGAASLLLASIGIFGVMAQAVTQRTHEIGVRMALGADRRDVLRMVLGRGLAIVLVGAGVGLGAALLLSRMMESLLFGVTARDALTFGAVPVVLATVALFAAWLPARRATKVDPIIALRYE